VLVIASCFKEETLVTGITAYQRTATPNGCAFMGTSETGKTNGEEGISVSVPPVPICKM